MFISSIIKTRDGFNGASISFEIKDNGISIGTMCDMIIITTHDMQLAVKYADIALRSIDILYGKPIVKCKYDKTLEYLDIYSAEIYVEESKK